MSQPADPHPAPSISDDAVEQLIGRLLQVGVLLAAAVTLAGALWFLTQHGGGRPSFGTFHGEPHYLSSIEGILGGVRDLRSDAVIQFGILLLIATPIARVALTLVAFAIQRDRTYVAITFLVLALLLYGLIFGRA